jgi:hypothetical protein
MTYYHQFGGSSHPPGTPLNQSSSFRVLEHAATVHLKQQSKERRQQRQPPHG